MITSPAVMRATAPAEVETDSEKGEAFVSECERRQRRKEKSRLDLIEDLK